MYDTAGLDHEECWPVLRREFAEAVRTGTGTGIDVHRGLRLQELLEAAGR